MKTIKSLRGQSGIESLLVYGFVILVAGGAVVLLTNMNAFSPQICDKLMFGFSSLTPLDWGIYYSSNDVLVTLRNDAGSAVQITGSSVSFTSVMCISNASFILQPGQAAIIRLSCDYGAHTIPEKQDVGSCYNADGIFDFTNLETGQTDRSKGRLRGKVEEGYIEAPASSSTTTTTATTTTTTAGPLEVVLVCPCDGCETCP